MEHGKATPRLSDTAGREGRIAALSADWISAPDEDRERIAEEIAGLIAGRVVPFQR